jgi:hypothetical protein
MTRPVVLALAAGVLVACADTNAPPPEPLELLLVVNRLANNLSIIPVDEPETASAVSLGSLESTPTTVAAREGYAVVPLGRADAVAVVELIRRALVNVIPLPEGSGATGAVMLNDSVAYVGNPGRNSISRVNILSRETEEILVGTTPQAFAISRGRLFVVNGNLDQTGEPAGPSWLSVLNPATNGPATGIDSIPLSGPGGAAFATVGAEGIIYVVSRGGTSQAEGRLSVVDPLERMEVASFAGLGLQPGDLSTDGQARVFVSSSSEGVLEFNSDSNAVIRGQGDGVPIPTNAGVAVDSEGRVYAIESGGCSGGRRGTAHVLDDELEEITRFALGRCASGAIVVRIGVQDSLTP